MQDRILLSLPRAGSRRCPRWDENRLLAAAEQHVDAQLQVAPHAQPANPTGTAPPVPGLRPAMLRQTLALRSGSQECQNGPDLLPTLSESQLLLYDLRHTVLRQIFAFQRGSQEF